MQRMLTTGLMVATVALLFLTAHLWLLLSWSMIVAIAWAFGTSLFSTVVLALWSHSWATFLLTAALYGFFKALRNKTLPHPVLWATLLAWAFFVRPTSSVSIAAFAVMMALYFRPALWRFAASGALWGALFAAYSWHYFGKWLPDYFACSRFVTHVWGEALAGNLVSPARGLFIYSPFLLLTIYLLTRYRRECSHKPLIIIGIAAILLHWVLISMAPDWWGGHCFGPRYMTDTLPWWLILTVLGIDAARKSRTTAPHTKTSLRIVAALLLGLSIFIHARGAYVYEAQLWNVIPNNIDEHLERLWDWSHPQFLAQ